MEFEPKQKNKVPELWVLCLFICAVVSIIFGNMNGINGRGILQTLSLVFFCALIFILVKYKYTRIRYTVRKKAPRGYGDEDGDEPENTQCSITALPPKSLELVVESARSRQTFVAENLIPLDKITACVKLPAGKAEKKALLNNYKEGKTFKYLRNMACPDKWLLVAENELGKVIIVFEPNEKMANYLCAVAAYNRENSK